MIIEDIVKDLDFGNASYRLSDPVGLLRYISLFRSMNELRAFKMSVTGKEEDVIRDLSNKNVIFCLGTAQQRFTPYFRPYEVSFYSNDPEGLYDFIRSASYGSGLTTSGNIRLTKDVEIPIHGKPVIIVEDIVDTGLTLKKIVEMLEERGPESIRICALIDKLERRDEEVSIDYCGFQVKGGFLVGYGLDYDEQYRYLPDIYVLRPKQEGDHER